MIEQTIKIEDNGLIQRLNDAPEIAEDEVRTFLETILAYLQRMVQSFTPIGTTGILRRSIKTDIYGANINLQGKVFPSAETVAYAEAIESGRRPGGKLPPKGTLVLWIQRKFGVDEFEAERLEYPVARNIARFGFLSIPKGAQMFGKAIERGMSFIEKEKNALAERIAGRIEGK